MSTVLVVDDDKKIVRLVRAYLEQANFTVLTAYDGETALYTLRREKPAVVVLDLMLPDRDGWDLTRLIRSDPELAGIGIIMLTARVEDTDRIVGLEMGADDYMVKPFNPREVVARVRAILRRLTPHRPQNTYQIDTLSLDADAHRVSLDNERLDLTPTEFSLLAVLVKRPGYTFSREALIEDALDSHAYEGMERTIDSHIKNLRKKLNAPAESPIYIETVYGVGYRLRGEG